MWHGKMIKDDPEMLLIMKTRDECVGDVIRLVEENHPYDCPECICVKVDSGS